jgi:hypothetical protein
VSSRADAATPPALKTQLAADRAGTPAIEK